jgi:hypothetical protein
MAEIRRIEALRGFMNEQFNLFHGPRALMVSDLAYAAGEVKHDHEAKQAVLAEIKRSIRVMEGWNKDKRLVNFDNGVTLSIQFLKDLKVVTATRDCVCVYLKRPEEFNVYFGFRGTSALRDVVPDAQLAANDKRVPRLDEAIRYAKSTLQVLRAIHPQIRRHDVFFGKMTYFLFFVFCFRAKFDTVVGHSLGGWIAEGVRNEFVGSRAIVLQPGAPVAWFSNKPVVRAWRPYQSKREDLFDRKHSILAARITRVVVHGDLVSGKGVENGKANIYQFGRVSMWNPLSNHFLDSVKRFFYRADGTQVQMSREWSDAVSEMRRSEKTLKDLTVLERLKKAKERSNQAILKYVEEGSDREEAGKVQRTVSTIYNKAATWFRSFKN